MPFLNGGHLWLILLLLVVLVIFGPKRLPELGSSVGRAITEFRKSTTQLKDDIRTHAEPVPEVSAAPDGEVSPQPATERSTASAVKA